MNILLQYISKIFEGTGTNNHQFMQGHLNSNIYNGYNRMIEKIFPSNDSKFETVVNNEVL